MMKIKNAWIVFAVTLLITLPLRLYQICFLSEEGTGFYTDGIRTTAIISSVLAVGAALMIMMSAMDRRSRAPYSPIRSIPAAAFGILTGVGVIAGCVTTLFGIESLQSQLAYTALTVLGVFAGIVLILAGSNFAAGKNTFENQPLLALVPSVWGCACLVAMFIRFVAVVNVAENIYDTFTVIFILLFLFHQAKLLARIDDEKSGKMIYMFGIPAALMALLTGISGTVKQVVHVTRQGLFPSGFYPANILFALYILFFLAAVSKNSVVRVSADIQEFVREPAQTAEGGAAEGGTEEENAALPQESCVEYLTRIYGSDICFFNHTNSPFLKRIEKS
jgi:hypothetical protein